MAFPTFPFPPANESTASSSQTSSCLPFNAKNRLITHDALETLLRHHGVKQKYRDINLYRLAMVHRSYCTRKNENFLTGNVHCPADVKVKLQENSNERLEFLGDAVLSLIVADYLFERFPDCDEGFLTTIRSKLVCGKSLAKLAEAIGLAEWLVVSRQIDDDNGRNNAKILEDTFEALLGAIFRDFGEDGFNAAQAFVTGVLEQYIDFATLICSAQSAKDRFIRFYASRFGSLPSFVDLDRTPGSNGGEIEISIKNRDGFVVAIGSGSSKKDAEADASARALKYYGQEMTFDS